MMQARHDLYSTNTVQTMAPPDRWSTLLLSLGCRRSIAPNHVHKNWHDRLNAYHTICKLNVLPTTRFSSFINSINHTLIQHGVFKAKHGLFFPGNGIGKGFNLQQVLI